MADGYYDQSNNSKPLNFSIPPFEHRVNVDGHPAADASDTIRLHLFGSEKVFFAMNPNDKVWPSGPRNDITTGVQSFAAPSGWVEDTVQPAPTPNGQMRQWHPANSAAPDRNAPFPDNGPPEQTTIRLLYNPISVGDSKNDFHRAVSGAPHVVPAADLKNLGPAMGTLSYGDNQFTRPPGASFTTEIRSATTMIIDGKPVLAVEGYTGNFSQTGEVDHRRAKFVAYLFDGGDGQMQEVSFRAPVTYNPTTKRSDESQFDQHVGEFKQSVSKLKLQKTQ